MTINAQDALAIANAECQQKGWGEIPLNRYTASFFQFEGRPAWEVHEMQIVVGWQVWFVIDAETGAVLKKDCLGIR